jgi:hypothetical protein
MITFLTLLGLWLLTKNRTDTVLTTGCALYFTALLDAVVMAWVAYLLLT